jgi:hypothetical protein
MNKLKLLGIVSILFLTYSCKKQIDFDKIKPITYNGDWAAPLAYGDYTIKDIIDVDSSSHYYYDQDGLIYLNYTSELFSLDLSDLVPNNKVNYSVSKDLTPAESALLLGTNSLTVFFSEDILIDDLNSNGISFELDSIEIKSGIFNFDITNRLAHNATFEMDIPALKLNGVPYSQTVPANANSSANIQIDVSGYTVDLTKNGTTHSTFEVNFKAIITKGAFPNAMGGIDVDLEIKNGYTIKTAYGDAKRQDFLAPNNTNLDIELFDFDEIGKTVFMEGAIIEFKWKNSFGVPIDVVFNSITGKNKAGQSFSLDVANIPSSELIVTSPLVVGQETSGDIVINNSKTQTGGGKLGMKDFINENIVEMTIDAAAMSNPLGITRPPFKNFIDENSFLKLDIEASLPLYGRALGYAFRDTFDMAIEAEADEIEKASIKLFSVNGFPVDLEGSIVFLDENDNALFTINKNPEFFFRAGEVDTDGKVVTPTENEIELVIEEKDLPKLGQVKKIGLIANFSTPSNGTKAVKFYKDDKLSIKIGARVKVKTEI